MQNLHQAGVPLPKASHAAVLLHGRGATAADILSLQQHLHLQHCALLALQAPGNTWYPYSFMAPVANNQPWLNQSLQQVGHAVEQIVQAGIPLTHIYLLGFSQGACLALEYAARHAAKYAGIAAFTGGLIGEQINHSFYQGNFSGTPVFLGSSDVDAHVPLQRVYASGNILTDMGATVVTKIYPGMGHSINEDEINTVNQLLFQPHLQ
jgi:phospholipase/carboxylesterase